LAKLEPPVFDRRCKLKLELKHRKNPMKTNLARRAFISSVAAAVTVESVWADVAAGQTSVLTPTRRKLLGAAANEIIPRAPGLLSATEAGVVDYIETLIGKVPELQRQAEASLARLEKIATTRWKRSFDQLTPPNRVAALRTFEREAAKSGAGESLYSAGGNLFAVLRDLVYEGYYTSPKVWPQIGYEFHPTNRKGPVMEAFDESILVQMKRRSRNYREVKS
jgi:Gluconate 2-dehydrogenase subunit 3